MRRTLAAIGLLLIGSPAHATPNTPWAGQCASTDLPSTIGCQPQAAVPIGTNVMLIWENTLTPKTRAVQVQQILNAGLPATFAGVTATTGTFSGAMTVGGLLGVTGNTTIGGTLGVTGATVLSSDLTVGGNTVLSGNLTVSGAVSGTGFTNLFASPPPLGNVAPNTVKGTTVTSTLGLYQGTDPALRLNLADKNVAIGTPYDVNGVDGGNFGNTAGGYQALQSFVGGSGHNNTAYGQSAMAAAVSTLAATAVGSNALAEDVDGAFNTGVGSNAGWVMQGAFGSVALGHGSQGGDDFTPAPNVGGQNTTLGSWSGQELTDGGGNTCAGASSCLFITTGAHNVGIGAYAAAGGPGATATAIGNDMQFNVAVGEIALRNNQSLFLTAVGYSALTANTTGILHTAFGRNALAASVADTRNAAFGTNAGQTLNGANNMAAFGAESQKINIDGADNSSFGSQTLINLVHGDGNSVFGTGTGLSLTDASFNVLIGQRVASTTLATGTGNILIGLNSNCDTDTASTSNTFRVCGTVGPIIDAININGVNVTIDFTGSAQVGASPILSLSPGELGFTKTATPGGAPGATGAKIMMVCGTNAGSVKLIAKAGTDATPYVIFDNIGGGVSGC